MLVWQKHTKLNWLATFHTMSKIVRNKILLDKIYGKMTVMILDISQRKGRFCQAWFFPIYAKSASMHIVQGGDTSYLCIASVARSLLTITRSDGAVMTKFKSNSPPSITCKVSKSTVWWRNWNPCYIIYLK